MNSRKEILLAALLSNPTIKQACATCGVPETTAYTWLKKPDFKAEYEQRQAQMLEDSVKCLQIKLNQAADTILGIMTSDKAPSQTRLNAARTVFEYIFKYREQQEIITRLEAIEKAVNTDNGF